MKSKETSPAIASRKIGEKKHAALQDAHQMRGSLENLFGFALLRPECAFEMRPPEIRILTRSPRRFCSAAAESSLGLASASSNVESGRTGNAPMYSGARLTITSHFAGFHIPAILDSVWSRERNSGRWQQAR